MLNIKPKVIKNSEFFPYFIVDDFIEQGIFNSIKEEFKILISRINTWDKNFGIQFSDNKKLDKPILSSGGKDNENSYDQILNLAADLFFLKKFILKINQIKTYETFFKLNKKIKIYNLNEKISLFNFFTKINARISIKISRSQSGSGIAIHRDSPDKILAMLLYFGYSDGVVRKSGGTQIYKLNDEGKKQNLNCTNKLNPHGLDHHYFSHINFQKILDVQPYPNRLFGFIRNQNSWHGVEPLDLKEKADIYRDTLQINLVKHRNYSFVLIVLKKIKDTLKKFL